MLLFIHHFPQLRIVITALACAFFEAGALHLQKLRHGEASPAVSVEEAHAAVSNGCLCHGENQATCWSVASQRGAVHDPS